MGARSRNSPGECPDVGRVCARVAASRVAVSTGPDFRLWRRNLERMSIMMTAQGESYGGKGK